jgi:hypothetical protein
VLSTDLNLVITAFLLLNLRIYFSRVLFLSIWTLSLGVLDMMHGAENVRVGDFQTVLLLLICEYQVHYLKGKICYSSLFTGAARIVQSVLAEFHTLPPRFAY